MASALKDLFTSYTISFSTRCRMSLANNNVSSVVAPSTVIRLKKIHFIRGIRPGPIIASRTLWLRNNNEIIYKSLTLEAKWGRQTEGNTEKCDGMALKIDWNQIIRIMSEERHTKQRVYALTDLVMESCAAVWSQLGFMCFLNVIHTSENVSHRHVHRATGSKKRKS